MKIPFNKPFLIGNEMKYISEAIKIGKISGNGYFTEKCEHFFEKKYGFKKTLLTTSCTHALEMAAILLDIKPNDEVIVPSFTFVSTANAFALRGAKIVFADSNILNPNIDCDKIENLINPKTKAIVVVHYAGIACDMDKIIEIANKHNLYVVEDAAQSIDSYYKNKPLGSFGHLATFSFHETKNIMCGEGGMLVINSDKFIDRAEIIREKGTNKKQFSLGKIHQYSWVDVGSSYVPSEINAAYLYAQLEKIDIIQSKRISLWENYYNGLMNLKDKIKLPVIPNFAKNNAHIFYIICQSKKDRDNLILKLKEEKIMAVFHYVSLHNSQFGKKQTPSYIDCPNSDYYSDCLLRLPMYYNLKSSEQNKVIKTIKEFYKNY
jgi:dTDP-4-amino-4,6-dideoxygalactose transaminase